MDTQEIEKIGGAGMKEYIEKSMIFAVLVDFPGELSPENIGLAIARKAIDNLPTADVSPMRHGRWKYYHKQNKAVCTCCSFERDLDVDFGRSVACPSCGALMDEKEAQP